MTVPPPIPFSPFTAPQLRRARRVRWLLHVLEWLLLVVLAVAYAGSPLLNMDPMVLQQSSEHNEAATLHVLTSQALRAGVIPLWNPYMSSGFPVAGDFVSNFWNPLATLPVWLLGGVNGYKVVAFLSFVAAGLGQWWLGRVLGLRWPLRLWSAALFMLSGGLALFWRLGWHQLLVGVVWFPWCFAALIWALRSSRRSAIALAALPIFMTLTSAGGYFFLYLGVSLTALTLLLVELAPPRQRFRRLGRALAIALLAGGLLGVVLLPGMDVLQHTTRETMGDRNQTGSQPIRYALFQYVVSDPDWLNLDVLGQGAGYSWYYLGALPLGALVFLPLALNRSQRRRQALLVVVGLTALLLLWHANRHNPIGRIYDLFPALYQFRFPNRLLVVAASPLLLLGAFGLQGLWGAGRRLSRRTTLWLELTGMGSARRVALPLNGLVTLALLALLLLSVHNVFTVNRAIAFTQNQQRDQRPLQAIRWLHEQDPELYYVEAGDWRIWWWWTTAAYELQQPLLNFAYNRHTNSFLAQQQEGAVVRAQPKYIFPWSDNPPMQATQLGTVADLAVYANPDALPFAFAVTPEQLERTTPLLPADVQPLAARWANPNQLIVEAEAGREGDQLIALVSTFPGWNVYVDDQSVPLKTVNHYLGVTMLAGRHTYRFSFEPPRFYVGLALSSLALLVALALLLADSVPGWRAAMQARPAPLKPLPSARDAG